ncbi:glycogen debranching protein GlgX [Synechococcus sp. Cruz-9H2]|uniref:glycogen debranching protein GlgX n=1 Tax=unclassified Synechococcus TaxID=2626047 RepID=UPI0020CBA1B9|nr:MULTISPECIES: glycogen debranching protein GlgX [unclassified Synechococcus]MCP9818820.1 glycogen debranching protein GlgX [Synechococcus sp. Cruz-9H2]MCP9843050.1 glycogen debranching protein GlgX [Synechococcus sp. Edmonson 11F2]MCP9857265.1 glycogen debranching protein GlgX [Synechococcus sp. Cruz-9C9]MCP9862038.1 glycogen debranching protein GlgX [Synechococcus sp. Cruz-7E5]MCP9869309.1 glycogen debranching protein GlgX [Synechococcus sp. Cruz-7B9]
MGSTTIWNGRSAPLGATVWGGGVNFSVYSKYATAVELLLFEREDAAEATRVVRLDPTRHRTYHYWHCLVDGIGAGQLYGYRVSGPHRPDLGLRFDERNLLLDPYGLAVVTPPGYRRAQGRSSADGHATAMKSVVADPALYDWEGDRPLQRSHAETVIYELHVRGFTRHPSSGVAPELAGTYAGLVEKIPYLVDLGITAVELLPVFQFDPLDAPVGLSNYWGYSPVSLLAPHSGYCSSRDPLAPLDEFRDMVKALHRAGIEVILDVVFNHTAEGDERGPSFCFRGLANESYYHLEADRSRYANFSGCGNTLNANHPVVRRLIRHSLRHWVQCMHVDGFRFDLASVLSRDETGQPHRLPPVLFDIETDPVLAGTKLIAEAWDAAGLYQVGSFIGDSWQEWNGQFRDDLRRFLKGDPGQVPRAALRLLGSPDLYGHEEREAEQSVNFITCHDGFTLADLVAYNEKHNDANGEANRDGASDNASWNCGVEGPSDDPGVQALRQRQIRNFLAVLLLAIGSPMLAMGDEVCRSQAGNNNAYCQDNPLSWFDWSLLERHADVHRFVKQLVAARMHRDVVIDQRRLSLNDLLRESRIDWHGVALDQPDWSESSRSFALTIRSIANRFRVHLMVNAFWEALSFELPPVEGWGTRWRCWIDTAQPSPDDIHDWGSSPALTTTHQRVEPRSLVAVFALQEQAEQ